MELPSQIPAPSVIAIATIVAALITGALSFVNLTLTKEQKTSEFRQAWIDGLRSDLSSFFAAVRTVARAESAFYETGERYKDQNFPWSSVQVAGQRQMASEMLYRIKMRLNPEEPKHIELLRLLNAALDEQAKIKKPTPSSAATVVALDAAADYARPVLKVEWDRVKMGELSFRIARNWVAPVIVVFCFIFIAVLLSAQFK